MTYEEKRKFMLQVKDETETTASRACLYYVICFWASPFTGEVDYRRGYFDDVSEGLKYREDLRALYRDKFMFNYFIASNLSSGDIDGGLLDD